MAIVTTQRSIATSIILTIFTCGIYGIFWFISLTDDIKNASDDDSIPSGGTAFLLTLVTCGIYGIYWAYRMGKGIMRAKEIAGYKNITDNSVLYLVLQIFGFAIVNYALMQNELNIIGQKSQAEYRRSENNHGSGDDNVEY